MAATETLHAADFKAQPLLDYQRLQTIAQTQHEAFVQADPFPHLVIDDFRRPERSIYW